MKEHNTLADNVRQLYQNMKRTYIPDTYSKVSMYLPIMATMELANGKSVIETIINRTIVTGTDLLNGIAVGISCDLVRRTFNALKEGPRQMIVDTVTSLAVLDALYSAYQYIACQITNRPTDTILPACISLAGILLATGGIYGKRRNNCRKDYSIEGDSLQKAKNMVLNDYYRMKNWMMTEMGIYVSALS